MNAPAEFPESLQEALRRATDRANSWRGRCVNHFAKGELIVGEALLAILSAKQLPMLLSQRITRLEAALEGDAKKGSALEGFKREVDNRNAVVHGAGRVFVDSEGQWLLSLHALDRAGPSKHCISEAESKERVRRLKSAVDRLQNAFSPSARTPGPAGTLSA